ncbi:hypothetical protein [Xenorhabdus bovienii]|uniref:hypothetical protein n=1 Tax=Xenorhabdus bovienii TaxID=40576 RepID=UPI0023B357FB|nr:hypothetical protein [Xenorhabdus bovienii]
MKFKKWLLAVLLTASNPLFAEQLLPVKVETLNQVHPAGTRYATVIVTARDDSVTVKNINVNRGNCRIDNYKSPFSTKETILPATLHYGQSVKVSFYNDCIASEVDVTTDKGAWRFTYD